jgi:hypothetical protein
MLYASQMVITCASDPRLVPCSLTLSITVLRSDSIIYKRLVSVIKKLIFERFSTAKEALQYAYDETLKQNKYLKITGVRKMINAYSKFAKI